MSSINVSDINNNQVSVGDSILKQTQQLTLNSSGFVCVFSTYLKSQIGNWQMQRFTCRVISWISSTVRIGA